MVFAKQSLKKSKADRLVSSLKSVYVEQLLASSPFPQAYSHAKQQDNTGWNIT